MNVFSINILTILFSFAPLLLPLHCLFIFLFRKWLGPVGTFYGSIIVFALVFIWVFNELILILRTGSYFYIDFGRWFFCLDHVDSHLLFCVDSLALLCAGLVLFLTCLALYFGIEYMYRDAFINRLLYLLNLFATSVIVLFFCYDFFLIIFAWECIGLFSFLLVNFYSMRIYTIKAALKTFVFARFSDLFMFLNFVLSILVFNTTDLSLIFLQIPFMSFHYLFWGPLAIHFLTLYSFCLAMTGTVKAAQFFSHVWLPDAMEAPTPASALIHSSTLVVAGVFLIIRFSLLYEFSIATNYYLIMLGAVTLAFGAITAIFQTDIKKLVAYSTISQIGYLVCGCGFCCYEEVLIYLIIHALNKAFLFILVGYLVHFFNNNTDMRQMGGAYVYSFDIAVFLLGVCFNLAGLPYSAGFIGKEFLLFQLFREDLISLFVRGCWLASFFFTPIYMVILLFVVLYGPKKGVLQTYKNVWLIDYFNNNAPTFGFKTSRFQLTFLTSRTTCYVLGATWFLFFWFGEFLLLILFNYGSITDAIPSAFFYVLKAHTPFFLNITNTSLLAAIAFYLKLLVVSAFIFLLTLRYTANLGYFTWLYFFDGIFWICVFASVCQMHFGIFLVFIFVLVRMNVMSREH